MIWFFLLLLLKFSPLDLSHETNLLNSMSTNAIPSPPPETSAATTIDPSG